MKCKERKSSRLMALVLSVMMVVAYTPTYMITYAADSYTITFKDGYTGDQISELSKEEGEGLTDSEYPAKPDHSSDGKSFDKWETDPADADLTNITQNITITATYTDLEQFDYVFKEAAQFGGAELKSGKVYKGGNITAPKEPSHEGYNFSGWDKSLTNVNSDLTITATYTEKTKFAVKFIDGYKGTTIGSEDVYEGDSVSYPEKPDHTYEGYRFKNWSGATEAEMSNVTKALTITANYEEIPTYKVKFRNDLSLDAESSFTLPADSSTKKDTEGEFDLPDSPKSTDKENLSDSEKEYKDTEGKTWYFVGWNLDGTVYAAGDTVKDIDDEVTFDAEWKQTLHIKFDVSKDDTEEDSIDDVIVCVDDVDSDTEDVEATLPAATATGDGLTFVGWAKKADADKADYKAGEKVKIKVKDAKLFAADKLYPVITDITPASLKFEPEKDIETGTVHKRDITIIAQDKGSGLKSLEYQIVREGKERSDKGWTSVELTEGATDALEETVSVPFGATLYARTQDVKGNEVTEDSVLLKEQTAPTVNITDPEENATEYKQSYNIEFRASDSADTNEDASGIKKITVYLGEEEIASAVFDEDGNLTSNTDILTYDRDAGKGTVTINSPKGSRDGSKTVRIEAEDFCANKADASRILLIDNTTPSIESIEMNGGVKADNTYYYKADNCGLTVKANDKLNIKSVAVKAEYDGNTVTLFEKSDYSGTDKVTVEISADDMVAKLGKDLEGEVVISVNVTDEAGNSATYNKGVVSGLVANEDNGTSSFVIDTVAPKLDSVVTDPSSEINYTDVGVTNYYYKDKATQTVYTIADSYLDTAATKLSFNGAETSDEVSSDNAITHSWGADGIYTDITLKAADKAGNVLTGENNNKAEDAYQTENGIAKFTYGKVIDTSAPKINVKYCFRAQDTDAKPYQYDEDGVPTLYVKAPVNAEVTITDEEKLDLDKFEVKRFGDNSAKAASALGGEQEKKDEKWTYTFIDDSLDADKDNTYKLVLDSKKIKDRAGNEAEIIEEKMEGQVRMPEGTEEDDTWNSDAKAATQAVFVYDTTNPIYTSAFDTLRAARYDENHNLLKAEESADGTTAYHNKAVEGTFTISDANLNTDILGANVSGPETSADHYSNETPGWKAPEYKDGKNNLDGERNTKATEAVYKVSTGTNGTDDYGNEISVQGVFRFTVGGTDKAGNPLVKGSDKSADGKDSYNATEEAEGGEGFWSMIKVVDTANPEFTFTAKDKEEFYNWNVNQNGDEDLKTYDPFRKSTKATAEIDSKDKSPTTLSYDVVWITEEEELSTSDDQKWATRTANISRPEEKTKDKVFETDVKSGTIEISDGDKNLEFKVRNIKIQDRAGNITGPYITNTVYLDTIPPKGEDEVPPTIRVITENTKVFKAASTGLGRDFYTGDVKFKIIVEDPNKFKSSSGLETVTYKVTAGNNSADVIQEGGVSKGVLLDDDAKAVREKGDSKLRYKFESEGVTVPHGAEYNSTNESNDLKIEVTSTDHAGNTSTNQYSFGIDSHGPILKVTWNSPLRGVGKDPKYYNFNRYATIKAIEQNFDDRSMVVDTRGSVSGWSDSKESGRTSYRTNSCSYTKDGDYSLEVNGKDMFGNTATISYTDNDNHSRFTIDKTAPVIKVTFDNNRVRNKKYYKANRTATVAVTEHNFDSKHVKVTGSAKTLRNGKLAFPGIGRFSGGDIHKATIAFNKEGKFNFDVNFTDLAGNKAKVVKVDEFVIDKTAPAVRIDGVDNNGIYGGTVSPRAVFEDDTFNSSESTFNFNGTAIYNRAGLISRRSIGEYGGTYSMDDFPHIRDNDDWYIATATSTDMAGNTTTVTKVFSVNRFGSSYDYNNDSATINLVDKKAGSYYTNSSQALVLREANVNPLVSYEVSLDRGGSSIKLKEGTDFTVTKNETDRGNMYIYKFSPDLFTDEGTYNIVVSSLDTAGNSNTNAAVRSEGKSRSVPVKFVYDVTKPDITFLNIAENESKMDGLKNDKRFSKNGVDVFQLGINPSDLISPVVYVKYTLGDIVEEYYNDQEKNITRLSDVTREDGRIVIDVPVNSDIRTQKLELVIRDAAGNEFVSEMPYSLTITNNVFELMLHYWYWILAALAAAGGGFYAYKRNRRDEEEEAA